ncbi:MAG: biopolymer transporter ExbD, partial [Gammaproteobacteria bacterium]
MALRMKSEQEAMSEINVTPLVDVMLVLLVIFIVTAPLMTRALHVELPESEATARPDQM